MIRRTRWALVSGLLLGGLPVVINAIVDALSEYGVRHVEMPATPQRIWQTIAEANGGKSA